MHFFVCVAFAWGGSRLSRSTLQLGLLKMQKVVLRLEAGWSSALLLHPPVDGEKLACSAAVETELSSPWKQLNVYIASQGVHGTHLGAFKSRQYLWGGPRCSRV